MPVTIKELDERPEINNLINIYGAFSGEKIENIIIILKENNCLILKRSM